MLEARLRRFVQDGLITITLPGGRRIAVGDPKAPDPVAVRLTGPLTPLKLALDPDRYLGEAYMDGSLAMEQGSIYDLLVLGMRNMERLPWKPVGTGRHLGLRALASIQQRNTKILSRRNVAHYDTSNAMYRAFLGEDMQYSCAYFGSPDMTLEAAQEAKKRHIAAKLLLQPGQRVLDIGCGWGGLALTLAELADVEVLGITLSKEQLTVARERAAARGLQKRVRFELIDYRTVTDRFDRIVSVGMFEHVGSPNYPTYFQAVSRLLAPDGVALIHSIGRHGGPTKPNSWLRKYIFPGGHIPALSEVLPSIENSGLWLTDLEVLRLHYATTLREWRERFMRTTGSATGGVDARFRRMWEFYLASSEASFRHGGLMVFQAQLSNTVDAVPLTRDYMAASEQAFTAPAIKAAE